MTDKLDLSLIRSLYGGYWDYDLKDRIGHGDI